MKRIEGRPNTPETKRLYWVWAAMIQRCHNQKCAGYKNYGARGVRVCDRWRSFDLFLKDMGIPAPGLSLERVDSTQNYSPDNCTWATRQQQNNNRPSWCGRVEIDGEILSFKQAWRKHADRSVTYRALIKRIAKGWPVSVALLIPSRRMEEA